MSFRNNGKVGIVHDKDNKMLRESAKHRYHDEKKELEREFKETSMKIKKSLNENYSYYNTVRDKDTYVLRFKKPDASDFVEFNIYYEENLKRLEKEFSDTVLNI